MVDELQKLKQHLPKEYARILAQEFKCTVGTVYKTLDGKTTRLDIIQRAIEIAREQKQKKEKIMSDLKKIESD
jgi:predicted transcriptional regulator